MSQVLEWCSDLGINTVSVFAFSIENFRRTAKEVEGLFRLAEEKVGKLLKSGYCCVFERILFFLFRTITFIFIFSTFRCINLHHHLSRLSVLLSIGAW